MGQTQRVSRNNTTVRSSGEELVCILHRTTIVCKRGNTVWLNSGGWRTVTTKTRMNQFANQYCGGSFRVFQDKGEWYVSRKGNLTGLNYVVPFEDGMEFTL
jgi:hypothetical protein